MYKFQRIKKKNLDLGTPILNMNSEERKPQKKKKKRRKHYFVPYILGIQSISFLNFCNCQFCHCYFQFTINLVPIINSLTENAYTTDIKYNWHT